MSKNMYFVEIEGDYPENEMLALQIQAGDKNAVDLLLSKNEGYITKLAKAGVSRCELEDLKQAGALALVKAAGRFDPACGTKLLTYATPLIKSALFDYAARNPFPLSVPDSRDRQLRKVGQLCAEVQDASEAELTETVCEELQVSDTAAKELLKDYRARYHSRQRGDDELLVSSDSDPAVVCDRLMRRTLLLQCMEELLSPRELNLVRSYLGIGQPDGKGMTFQELAIRLNYNDASGAEKAYKAALRKLKEDLYGGAYGRWLYAQKAIRIAMAEASQDTYQYTAPQKTWWEQQGQPDHFVCEATLP